VLVGSCWDSNPLLHAEFLRSSNCGRENIRSITPANRRAVPRARGRSKHCRSKKISGMAGDKFILRSSSAAALLATLPGPFLPALSRLLATALSGLLVLLARLMLSSTALLSTTGLTATLVLLAGPFIWLVDVRSSLLPPCADNSRV
jgi:hypothetical protein